MSKVFADHRRQRVFADHRCQKFSQIIGVKSFRRPYCSQTIGVKSCQKQRLQRVSSDYMCQRFSQTIGVKRFRRPWVSKVFAACEGGGGVQSIRRTHAPCFSQTRAGMLGCPKYSQNTCSIVFADSSWHVPVFFAGVVGMMCQNVSQTPRCHKFSQNACVLHVSKVFADFSCDKNVGGAAAP